MKTSNQYPNMIDHTRYDGNRPASLKHMVTPEQPTHPNSQIREMLKPGIVRGDIVGVVVEVMAEDVSTYGEERY